MAAQTITPKSMKKPDKTGEFDRAEVLRQLFSIPVPPSQHGNARTFPIHTPLGRIMRLKGLTVRDVDAMRDGVPNYRVLSDYLAGRKKMSAHHRVALGRALGVDSRVF